MKSLEELYGVSQEGVWHSTNEVDPEAPAFQCTHYDPTTPQVQAVIAKHSRKFRALIRNEKLPPEQDREIMVRTFFECSMKNWRNVSLDGVVELPFTADNAVAVFARYSKLFAFATNEAQRDAAYKMTEDDVKN